MPDAACARRRETSALGRPATHQAGTRRDEMRGLSVYDLRLCPVIRCRLRSNRSGVRHRRISGSNLRAAVFGVNDGLVSNVSLIMRRGG